MLKVAIVGCGKIADAHAAQIQRIGGAEIVAVCDTEPLMARQLAERYQVKQQFVDLERLLSEARPDVVHITTPPESHFTLTAMCLEQGCHVYVEKPFTLNYPEAQQLIALAEQKGLKVTAGHDAQFGHAARRMRELVQSGYLGGDPVHLESYYCYELGDSSYVRALLTDKQHWVRRLPGKLLHNIISHGVAKVAEFLRGDSPQVIAHGFVSPFLQRMGESELVDELRVIIHDEQDTTAYFTFSSQMRPVLHQLRVYGPKNGFVIDQDQETLIRLSGKRGKSYLEKFVPPIEYSRQYLKNLSMNMSAFLKRDFHMSAGMYYLIESFYRSITQGTSVPISYREILIIAKLMDDIFGQVNERNEQPASQRTASRIKVVSR
ncbi:MAG: Gfo/Idh/MocA family oxidoreductase [Nitrospira sp.]|nr:Gfo/Idh/MocA family oxidoreductase [Nitrospira sp.]